MSNNGWRSARKRVGLEVRVHDLKHTFGRRLRAANVSFEDRQDLLGHRSGRITTHYSAAELENLYTAANKACEPHRSGVVLTLVRQSKQKSASSLQEIGLPEMVVEPSMEIARPRKSPARALSGVC